MPAFAAIAAAVIGILGRSAFKLSRLTLARDRTLWAIAAANVAAVVLLKQESLLVLVASGFVALGVANRQLTERLATVIVSQLGAFPSLIASSPIAALPSLFAFFSVAGLTVFGSGLAIVPYLYHGVVEQHHWLSNAQFLDAIAVSMITPGPVVITVAFIGYIVAGIPGAVVSAVGVFLPAYIVVIAVAPHFERVRRNPRARRFVEGITAGATGAIGGAAILLAARVLTDTRSIAIAVVAVLAIATRLRIPEPFVVLAAAAVGIMLA
jgi:chromate transporter